VSDALKELLAQFGGYGVLIWLGALFVKERVKRADTQLDAANARAQASEAKAEKYVDLWGKEVKARVRAAVTPAPRHVPDSLAPPTWDEDTQVRSMREELEQGELARLRAETLDRSLLSYVEPTEPPPDPGPRKRMPSRRG
jgi:hypothetical protein